MWNIPAEITESRDDQSQLNYVSSLLKNPELFVERVTYLYEHPAEHSHKEVEMKDGRVFDRDSGLSNHRKFQEHLEAEVRRASRCRQPLSLVMLDVDYFKQYNDTYGHLEGDAVLKRVSALLQSVVRDTDLVARYGGDEFALILAQTDPADALRAAERIRVAVESASWEKRAITVSIGICSLSMNTADPAALIACADQALYRSKKEGKNRVTQGCDAVDPAPSAIMVLK